MIRGTTPTHTFKFPFLISSATKLNIAYSQDDVLVLEKDLADCTINLNKATVTLTQYDTLLFDSKKNNTEIQVRLIVDDKAIASKTIQTTVSKILKEGAL